MSKLWRNSFSVGIPAIDRDHAEFLTLCEDLAAAIAAAETQDVVAALLHRILRHTLDHFEHEETVLRDIGFDTYAPQVFAEHLSAHEDLRGRLAALCGTVATAPLDGAQVVDLVALLLDHMMTHDIRYKSFAQEQARENCSRATGPDLTFGDPAPH